MTGQALRETLGFMGVVGSLLFVGLEIRQNTRVARAEAYRSIEQTQTEWNFVAASDPDLALLLRRVTLDGARRDGLTDTEKWQAGVMYQALVQNMQSIYQVEESILPASAFDALGQVNNAFRAPYMQDVWPVMRPNFIPDFASFFETRFALAP
jgi:hypothetical protein